MPSQKTGEVDESDIAELRDEYPSGWRILTQHESVGYMIDALMDAPEYHFTKSKLAEKAGVSRQSVHTHLSLLLTLGIIEVVENSSPEKYTLSSDNEIVRELHRLNGLVNQKLSQE
ncbi:ArsR family transcriptional regulator [Halorutilales archaeon Cl-col2-1]